MKIFLNTFLLLAVAATAQAKEIKLLNVSYDPTRELYVDYNAAFTKYWQAKSGDTVNVSQSHGGSGKQAQSGVPLHDAGINRSGVDNAETTQIIPGDAL